MTNFPAKLKRLFEPSRYKELHGGRGGAKSWGVARALLIQGAKQPLRILCAREFQNSIRDSVLKLLADQVEALGLGNFYEVQTQIIRGKNGTEFAFEGLRQNISRIKSYEAVDRVWVEEAQTVSKNSWDILIPTIRKENSEIWLTWNPEFEDDETYVRFIARPPSDCIHFELNWRDNPWFPQVLEQEKADLYARDPDSYDHVWEGKCRQWLEGSIYAKELRKAYEEKRISAVAYEPNSAVFTAWDLGHTDDTAIWWYQVIHGEIHILESYASSGGSLSEYASQILGREVTIDLVGEDVVAKIGPAIEDLSHRRHYKYKRHWLPHDARAKTLAAKGKSIIQQLATALDLTNLAIVPDIGVEDGIQAARMMFGRCWFDEQGCDPGLKALRRYQREKQQDERSFKKIPKHDWTSHYCLTGDTEVLTRYGTYQIMNLPETGEVLTSCGWKRYQNPKITRRNAPLVEVQFADGLTVKCTPEHQFKTASGWKYASDLQSGSLIQSSLTHSHSISMAVSTACGQVSAICREAATNFIEMFGRVLSAQFQTVATSITSTPILSTMRFPTWNAYQPKSIPGNPKHSILALASLQDCVPLNGIDLKKDGFGTAVMQSEWKVGRNGSALRKLAQVAARIFRGLKERAVIVRNTALSRAKPLTIVSVKKLSERADTWCLTVPEAREFSLANGALVHNSDAFRMLAVATQNEIKFAPPKKKSQTEVRGLPGGLISVGCLEDLYKAQPHSPARI